MPESKEALKQQQQQQQQKTPGNSLAVQWLRSHAFTAEGPGSIPGGRTKIPQVPRHSQENQNQNQNHPPHPSANNRGMSKGHSNRWQKLEQCEKQDK